MKKNWLSSVLQDPARQPWILAALLALMSVGLWVFVLATFPRNTPAAVLHYSVGVGIDFIGEGKQIIVLPAVGTGILLLNATLAYILRRVSRAAIWILFGGAAVIQILLVVAYTFILLLN